MRKRRNDDRGISARLAGAAASVGVRLLAKVTRRPVDSCAILAAVGASLVIVVNAIFLQVGSHPAPFFATPKPLQTVSEIVPKPAEPAAPAHAAPAPVVPLSVAVRRNDPIAELIGPSPRIAAVQRALADYGYGQIRASGILDDATSTAIQKFEHDHKLPVTGQISDRLINGLTSLAGHQL